MPLFLNLSRVPSLSGASKTETYALCMTWYEIHFRTVVLIPCQIWNWKISPGMGSFEDYNHLPANFT